MPEGMDFCTKGDMALRMIYRLRREGPRFSHIVFDAGYGHLQWLLRALDGERETFLAEIHSDQTIYLSDPAPVVPVRQTSKGMAPGRLQAQTPPLTVAAWAATQPASRWCRLAVCGGEKGDVVADSHENPAEISDGPPDPRALGRPHFFEAALSR